MYHTLEENKNGKDDMKLKNRAMNRNRYKLVIIPIGKYLDQISAIEFRALKSYEDHEIFPSLFEYT